MIISDEEDGLGRTRSTTCSTSPSPHHLLESQMRRTDVLLYLTFSQSTSSFFSSLATLILMLCCGHQGLGRVRTFHTTWWQPCWRRCPISVHTLSLWASVNMAEKMNMFLSFCSRAILALVLLSLTTRWIYSRSTSSSSSSSKAILMLVVLVLPAPPCICSDSVSSLLCFVRLFWNQTFTCKITITIALEFWKYSDILSSCYWQLQLQLQQ